MVLEGDFGGVVGPFSKSFSEESVSNLPIYGSIRGIYGVYTLLNFATLANISI